MSKINGVFIPSVAEMKRQSIEKDRLNEISKRREEDVRQQAEQKLIFEALQHATRYLSKSIEDTSFKGEFSTQLFLSSLFPQLPNQYYDEAIHQLIEPFREQGYTIKYCNSGDYWFHYYKNYSILVSWS